MARHLHCDHCNSRIDAGEEYFRIGTRESSNSYDSPWRDIDKSCLSSIMSTGRIGLLDGSIQGVRVEVDKA